MGQEDGQERENGMTTRAMDGAAGIGIGIGELAPGEVEMCAGCEEEIVLRGQYCLTCVRIHAELMQRMRAGEAFRAEALRLARRLDREAAAAAGQDAASQDASGEAAGGEADPYPAPSQPWSWVWTGSLWLGGLWLAYEFVTVCWRVALHVTA
jgi:hypothetical protein